MTLQDSVIALVRNLGLGKIYIMKNVLTTIVVLIAALFCNTSTVAQHQLVKLWETDSVLKVPESVLLDAPNNSLFVTNFDVTDPWAKVGKGSFG